MALPWSSGEKKSSTKKAGLPWARKSGSSASSLPALEAQAVAAGAPVPAQDSPGAFRRVIDVMMRPNYAVAGAAEELLSPGGGGAAAVPGRVASELLSGIGGLQGQKEGFTQVMEQAGVGDLGKVSDVIPLADSPIGMFRKGGVFDVTGRGTLGFFADVVTDPTTYMSFGVAGTTAKVGEKFLSRSGQKLLSREALKATEDIAVRAAAVKAAKAAEPALTSAAANQAIGRGTSAAPVLRDIAIAKAKERVGAAIDAGAKGLLDRGGIKFAGIHVADNPLSAIANSGVSKEIAAKLSTTLPGRAVAASTGWTKRNLVDPLGSLFVKGYGIRGLQGAQPIMDDALNKEAFLKYTAQEEIKASPLGAWYGKSKKEIESEFRPVIQAYQAGGISAVPDKYKPAMGYYAKKVKDMYAEEVAAGLLGREQKLANYFAHYYENDVEDLMRVVYKHRGSLGNFKDDVTRMLRMGRNAEERAFDTLKDAEEISARLNAQNKSIPILRPVYNPLDSLTRRWEHSITKRVNREMVTSLEKKFGPMATKDIYDLATPVKYGPGAAKQKAAVDTLLAQDSKAINKTKALTKLSDEAKRDFFLQRFKQIGSREEAANVLRKYQGFEPYFPKRLVQVDSDFAADGSRFIEFNPGDGSSFTATLPESLAHEVAGMSDHIVQSKAGRTILQGFDTVNNFWKGSVTWIFPAFHARNAYSNVAQSFVDIGMHAINPASYVETAHILFGNGPGTFKTALGSYSYDEVRKILNRHGVNTSARAIAEFTGNESKILKPFKAFREAGTAIENESRAQLALNYLRRGMEPEAVGARVKKFQLDYSGGLTSFERQWMKRIIPFYSFQRLNLSLQLDNILKRPGMTLTQVKPFLGRHDENSQLTSWEAGALKLRLNRNGRDVQMITGIDLPIRNLDLLFRGSLKDTFANAVGMMTPLAKIPIEVAANESLFTGREFERTNAPMAGRIVEQMPVSVQKWMGYSKTHDEAGRPKYTLDAQRYYLIGQAYATSRILSTADRQWREYIDKADGSTLQSLLDVMTGLRVKTLNLDEQRAKRLAERKRDIERSLIRWGKRNEYRKVYDPRGAQ